jgi:hypothetical protein
MNFHTADGEDYYESMINKHSLLPTPIPSHLSDEEIEEWICKLEQEKQRRKRKNNEHV